MVPGLLGFLGGSAAGAAMAPALQVLTWPFLAITAVMLTRGWYMEFAHRGGWRSPWARRSTVVLMASTALALVLWGLRFSGNLGQAPIG